MELNLRQLDKRNNMKPINYEVVWVTLESGTRKLARWGLRNGGQWQFAIFSTVDGDGKTKYPSIEQNDKVVSWEYVK